MLSVGN